MHPISDLRETTESKAELVRLKDAAGSFLTLSGLKLNNVQCVVQVPSVKPPLEKLSLDDLLHLERVVRAMIEKRMREERTKSRPK
ncbi:MULTISPECIES: hypothetical protein [Bradyrhizobium]|uniref:hypothetical protein n=1 Tax=Bradyrhizobium TaxID=374 RepID=UPI001EDC378E|nr:hypothetical protein [Bradyrhizobium zhengyangense]MCG2645795.1 hypothetical protein [Bradyrhizobium zhengyangense]